MKIKIVGLCASPRKSASLYVTEQALKAAQAYDPQIETELVTFAGKKFDACNGCDYCKKNKCWCCKKDDMQEMFDKVIHADGLLVVSPVYVMGSTPQLHAFASRMRPAMHCFPELLRNKFFAAITVGGTRNGGEETAIDDIMHLFATRTMNFVSNENGGYTGGKVWSKDQGPQGAASDLIGMETALNVSAKLAEVCLTYAAGKAALLGNMKKVSGEED